MEEIGPFCGEKKNGMLKEEKVYRMQRKRKYGGGNGGGGEGSGGIETLLLYPDVSEVLY